MEDAAFAADEDGLILVRHDANEQLSLYYLTGEGDAISSSVPFGRSVPTSSR